MAVNPSHCGEPGYGVSAHENEYFVMGRMEGVNRTDMPFVSTAIAERTMVKVGGDGKTLEPVTASTDTLAGIIVCDKADGVTRANVFVQGDFNRDLVLPRGLDYDQLTASSSFRITLKTPIRTGLE